jgi:REP element-mobilizing transposase RayT
LYSYLSGIALGNETKPLEVGGMPDHVHLLLSFGREVTIADTIKSLKTASSRCSPNGYLQYPTLGL